MPQPMSPPLSEGVAPLVALVARTLAATSGYQMSPAFLELLGEDYDLLAALQRLAFAAARPSSALPLRAGRSIWRCPCGKGHLCSYPDCPLGDPLCSEQGKEEEHERAV